jgi:RNA polymerase sigma-70 factor (ECF subfamily)
MDDAEQSKQLEKAASGDAEALQCLIVSYHPTLRRRVASEIEERFRQQIDPDDVLQSAYIAAFRHIGEYRFHTRGGPYKWLERIARNKLIDRKRALMSRKSDVGREIPAATGTSDPHQDLVQRLGYTNATSSRHLGVREATAVVMSSFARLSDDRRAIVRMRYLEGQPVAEIAATLGKSQGSVLMRCHRGLTQLYELMVSITKHLSRL